MSHELSIRADGFVEHAYTGQVGWTGLGNRLEDGASIEEWQKAAGMDWRIQRSIVRFAVARDADGVPTAFSDMPNKHVLMRSDTKAALSVVSDNFKVVQPKAVLEFFRDLAGNGGFNLETAGCLFDGRRFWAMAKAGEDCEIGKGDKMRCRLLLSTSCDGSLATEGRFVAMRVVCNNTLGAAMGEGKALSRTTHRSVFRPEEMKKDLGVEAKEQFAEFMAGMRRLADTQLAVDEVVSMTAELFVPGAAKKAKDDFIKVLESRAVKTVMELVLDGKAKGSGFDGVKGTAYGWLNGVTEYVDHHVKARSEDNRRNSALWGAGDALKTRALTMALSA